MSLQDNIRQPRMVCTESSDDVGSHARMLFNEAALLSRQPAGFGEQLLRNRKNANVVQQACQGEPSQLGSEITKTDADLRGQDADIDEIGDQWRAWGARQGLNN
jgi:hypothetical protein